MAALGYRYYLLMILPFMLAMCLVKNLRQVVTFNHVFKYVKRLHIYTCSIKIYIYLSLDLFRIVTFLQISVTIFNPSKHNTVDRIRDYFLLHIRWLWIKTI